MKKSLLLSSLCLLSVISSSYAQDGAKAEDTEYYTPVPTIVTPGKTYGIPPSDAIILFDGKSMNKWVSANDYSKPADWKVENGIVTVNKKFGSIQTADSFLDYQLHIEWRIPSDIQGKGQARGNSGLFLGSTGKGDDGYELQILDSYNNATYVNGQAGSIYKQYSPLVNANRPPGAWQTYDVIWTAPRFNDDGSLKSPARVTAIFNGVLIQNNVELKGPTKYIGTPSWAVAHGPSPIKLQAHGDDSKPISFRNIWLRKL